MKLLKIFFVVLLASFLGFYGAFKLNVIDTSYKVKKTSVVSQDFSQPQAQPPIQDKCSLARNAFCSNFKNINESNECLLARADLHDDCRVELEAKVKSFWLPCLNDLEKFCFKVRSNNLEIKKCLEAHQESLEKACKPFVVGNGIQK